MWLRPAFLVSSVALGLVSVAIGCGTDISEFEPDLKDAAPTPTPEAGPGFSSGGRNEDAGKGGDDDGGPACATARAQTTRKPVYLDLVLDGSGSMDGMRPTPGPNYCNPNALPVDCEQCTPSTAACWMVDSRIDDPLGPTGRRTGKRWVAARGALKAYFDQKALEARNDLAIGMSVFATAPAQAAVPIARIDTAQATALWNVISPGVWPDGLTPMRTALEAERTALAAFAPAAPLLADGTRVLVLITDGVPYGGTGNTYETKAGVSESVLAALGGSPRIATAVIGVGNPADLPDSYDAAFLSQLAQSGGLAPAGCNPNWTMGASGVPCHLQITPGEKDAAVLQAEIAQAIEAIGIQVASCELALDQSAEIDPAKVNVVYTDGDEDPVQIAQGEPDGWTYDDDENPTQVILHGASCERLKAEPNGKVDIVIGCPTGTEVIDVH